MTVGPNGVLYAASQNSGTVVAIPQQGRTVVVLRGLNGPHTLQFRDNDLYVSVGDGVLRFRNAVTDEFIITSQSERVLTVPSGAGHSTRTLGFGPDGKLYVSIGSTCNFCIESDQRRAAMLQFEADGSGQKFFARGLRNSVGFAWHPVTGEMWAVDNGGDGIGDDNPPEEINVIKESGDYGWPDCIGNQRPVQWSAQARPSRCAQTNAPEWEMQAHSAPLGISFYTGDQFPVSYMNDAFVAFHGSWNRNQPTGYKVVRIHAASGRATSQEDFLAGFLDSRPSRSGRPVYPITGSDGALYISDDSNTNIYRVEYVGPRINPGGIVNVTENAYAIYGKHLASDPAQLRVAVNGINAEVLYASEGQINFLLPAGITGDVAVSVTNELASDEGVITIRDM